MIAGYSMRSLTATSGTHLRLIRSGTSSRAQSANTLPATLNTDKSAENGKVSSAAGCSRQQALSCSPVNMREPLGGDALEDLQVGGELALRDRPVQHELGDADLPVAPGPVDERLEGREGTLLLGPAHVEQREFELGDVPAARRARLAQPRDLPGDAPRAVLRRAERDPALTQLGGQPQRARTDRRDVERHPRPLRAA